MKYYLILLLTFTFFQKSFCQNEPEKMEQYCIVKCTSSFSKTFTADFDFGDKLRPIMGWAVAKDSSGSILRFKSEADVLNYMGKQGWRLVNAYPADKDVTIKYVFKKKFLRSEIKAE